jgi:hypothetical protein
VDRSDLVATSSQDHPARDDGDDARKGERDADQHGSIQPDARAAGP